MRKSNLTSHLFQYSFKSCHPFIKKAKYWYSSSSETESDLGKKKCYSATFPKEGSAYTHFEMLNLNSIQ